LFERQSTLTENNNGLELKLIKFYKEDEIIINYFYNFERYS